MNCQVALVIVAAAKAVHLLDVLDAEVLRAGIRAHDGGVTVAVAQAVHVERTFVTGTIGVRTGVRVGATLGEGSRGTTIPTDHRVHKA